MPTSFDAESPHLAALRVVISRLEAVEVELRAAEAERLRLLAEALDLAAAENERRISSAPSGARGELAYRAVRAEIASALHRSEGATERLMDHARTLTAGYPRAFEAYRDGEISGQHTHVIADAGRVVGSGDAPDSVLRRAGYEEAVLEFARSETPARLRPIARRLAEQYAERDLTERHREAAARRRVYLLDGEDGMSDLVAHLPAVEAHGIYARLTAASRELEHAEAAAARPGLTASGTGASPAPRRSRRSRDAIRADLLSDLLLESGRDGEPMRENGIAAVQARVQVTIPGELLAGAGGPPGRLFGSLFGAPSGGTSGGPGDVDGLGAPAPPPAILAGYGPIDPETARLLAGRAAHWDAVRLSDHGSAARRGGSDPAAGAGAEAGAGAGAGAGAWAWAGAGAGAARVLSVDRYRPSEDMRRYLRARDLHCRFPGCCAPLSRCDIDHTVDAALGGATATDNLAHLCRGHHTLKHHTAWSVRQRSEGELEWTSPTGRVHRERPPSRVYFAPVPPASPLFSGRHAGIGSASKPDTRPKLRRLLAGAPDLGSDRDPPPF